MTTIQTHYQCLSISLFVFKFALLLLSLLNQTFGYVPIPCASNVTNLPSVCCPTPSGFSNPCGYPSRGVCIRFDNFQEVAINKLAYFYTKDHRLFWPRRVFQFGCQCMDRFWGPDCNDCWFGFEGPSCSERKILKRRDIKSYSTKEKQNLVDVLIKANEVPSKFMMPRVFPEDTRLNGRFMEASVTQEISYLHWTLAYPRVTENHTLCKLLTDRHLDFGHYFTGFLTAHRYLLLYWERLLRRIAWDHYKIKDFTFPFWDWTDKTSCEVCTNDIVGEEAIGAVSPGTNGWRLSPGSQFSNLTIYCADASPKKDFCKSCVINGDESFHIGRRWRSQEFPKSMDIRKALSLTNFFWAEDQCAGFTHMTEAGLKCTCSDSHKLPVQLHAQVHVNIAGTFNPVGSSPYDPLFMFHHSQIDRLFERWLRGIKPPSMELPSSAFAANQCRDCRIAGFYPTVNHRDMFTDCRRIGYTYEHFNFGILSEDEKVCNVNNRYRKVTCSTNYFNLV